MTDYEKKEHKKVLAMFDKLILEQNNTIDRKYSEIKVSLSMPNNFKPDYINDLIYSIHEQEMIKYVFLTMKQNELNKYA